MNSENIKISVVIPAFNEGATIADIITKLKKNEFIYEIIIVDDGSKDDTAEAAKKAGAVVVKHPYNIGNGAAVKTGCRNATGNYILLMDADGQHPPEKIKDLVEHINDYDMVVAARTSKSNVSKFRGIGNFILIQIAQYLSEQKIMDLTSGFRLINKDKCNKFLHLFPNKYSYPTTITLCFFNSGYSVKYVPLHEIVKRQAGESNISPFKDGIKFITIIVRIIMLFSPMKIFLPAAATLFLIGCLSLFYSLVILKHGIEQMAVLTILSSIIILFFGFMSEQLSEIRKRLK